MKCQDCKYCIQEDFGYSNWTVEGVDADCLLNLNPCLPMDRFYGEEPALDYAQQCASFVQGDCVEVDCDHEDGDLVNYSSDPEIKDLLRKRMTA